jgi:hypothetical protein
MYRMTNTVTRARTGACCALAAAAVAAAAPAAHADTLNPQPLPPGHHIGPVAPSLRSRIAFTRDSIKLLPPDPCIHPFRVN